MQDLDSVAVVAIQEGLDKSATNVARSAILPVIAQRVAPVDMADIQVEGSAAVTVEGPAGKHAILAADMDTCPATAHRGKSATIVSDASLTMSLVYNHIIIRWRGWSPQPRLPTGSELRARMLQVQAARSCPGCVP